MKSYIYHNFIYLKLPNNDTQSFSAQMQLKAFQVYLFIRAAKFQLKHTEWKRVYSDISNCNYVSKLMAQYFKIVKWILYSGQRNSVFWRALIILYNQTNF